MLDEIHEVIPHNGGRWGLACLREGVFNGVILNATEAGIK